MKRKRETLLLILYKQKGSEETAAGPPFWALIQILKSDSSTSIKLPVDGLGKHQKMAQVLVSFTQDISYSPGFSLAQPWLLQPFME